MLAGGLAIGAVPPSTVFAVPGSIPLRQATPDLTAVKTNNVGGLAAAGAPWIWTIDIANGGTATATFNDGQIVFVDNLPNANVGYGIPTVAPPTGGASGPITCEVDFTVRLTCVANGGPVSLPSGGAFRVAVSAASSTLGAFANPRAGGACTVDPNNTVGEGAGEGNNACADTVTVRGPDLTVAKTNNVGGAAVPGAPWTWTVTVTNAGTTTATFAATQAVLFDHLPTSNVTYGTPTVTPSGGASGPLVCTIDFSLRLACFATGGVVTLPPGGSFQIAFTATASAPAVFASPRAGQACAVDPVGVVVEASEGNNLCADTVTVAYQTGRPASAANNEDDDDDDERPLTETQRHQRSHTNASGQDDYRTEGNVLEVRCDTSTEPRYEVSFPTHTPYLVIATRDGNQQLRLLYDTRSQCQ
jgi:hypothetical protein